MKAIETTYANCRFRSRLEAKWAAFFDALNWTWTYEPFDADGYIPDFLIDGDAPLLVEVKPAVTEAQYRAPIGKIVNGLRGHWDEDVLIVGAAPAAVITPHSPAAGMLGQHFGPELREEHGFEEWQFEPGEWHRCLKCGRIAVHHAIQIFNSRPCGCYDGDSYLGEIGQSEVQSLWNTAISAVQWTRGGSR